MLFVAKRRSGRPIGHFLPPAGFPGGGFSCCGLMLMLIGLVLALSLPAAAQNKAPAGPGRKVDEFYAPYRGDPENEARLNKIEPRKLVENEKPLRDEMPGPPEARPPRSAAPGLDGPPVNDAKATASVVEGLGPPASRVSERGQAQFEDGGQARFDDDGLLLDDPEQYREYFEYQAPAVVPLPPVVRPSSASGSPWGGEGEGPAGAEQRRPLSGGPAGAAPALSLYGDEARTALPKDAVPGLISHPKDVALIEKLRKKNDPSGRLDWEKGAEVSGTGLQADAEGRLCGLKLENLSLSGVMDLSGAEGLLEFKSVGNPLAGLKMGGLARLRSLTLTGASLSRLERSALAGLTALSSLELNQSGLEKIDPEALADLKSLETLSLDGNRLERLGRGCFAGLEALSELNLNGNQLSEVRWGALAPLTGLVTLYLADNRLTEIHDGFFPGLANLEILHLENNYLTHLTRTALDGLTSLKYIDLSNNYLRSIPSLGHLENLSEVDLTGNCLSLGAIKEILETAPEGATLHLKGQENVYFGLRVQLLPGQDHYLIPPEDAFIDEIPSHGRILGPDPGGADYAPPEIPGQPGRLTFHRPGLYTLVLSNSGLGDAPDISAAVGDFLIVDCCPDTAEAARLLGNRNLAGGLVRALAGQGFVEAPASNPKRASALKALFSPAPGDVSGHASRALE